MNEQAYLPMLLLTVRGACHFLIFLRVVTYTPSTRDQHRKVVGFAASLFAGLNLAESVRILNNFSDFILIVEPYLPGVMLFVLVFVTWAGGNLARFFPQKLLQRLP